jgi:hypothetical protein
MRLELPTGALDSQKSQELPAWQLVPASAVGCGRQLVPARQLVGQAHRTAYAPHRTAGARHRRRTAPHRARTAPHRPRTRTRTAYADPYAPRTPTACGTIEGGPDGGVASRRDPGESGGSSDECTF